MTDRQNCPTPRKREYKTVHSAKQSAFSVFRDKGYKLKPYLCQCGMYHLTKHLNYRDGEWRLNYRDGEWR